MSRASGHGHSPKGRRPKAHAEEEHENHERWLVSYADMLTLLFALFVVLYAISQVDQAKFAQFAKGLSASFGAPISALTNQQADNSVIDGMPKPADIASGIGASGSGSTVSQSQVDAAAAQAALQRSQAVQTEA